MIDHGCRVTAFDSSPLDLSGVDAERFSRLNLLSGDVTDETSVQDGFANAQERFGPANVLVVNSSLEDKTTEQPVWDLPLDVWEKNYKVTVQGSFLAIKHFLRCVRDCQQSASVELASPAIVMTETESGTAVAGGKAGLHYGLLNTVRDEVKKLDVDGRINAVVPGLVNGADGKGSAPADVARTMAFLASKRAAGHISGQCIRVEGSKDLVTKENKATTSEIAVQSIPRSLPKPKRNKIRVAVSIDLDAVSGWLGTSMSETKRNLATSELY